MNTQPLIILFAVGMAAPAWPCTPIDAVPFKIAAPGVYCLVADLSHTSPDEDAIIIFSDHVTIDLQGFRLTGSQAGSSSRAQGVGARGYSNVTVRNGTIEGFAVAVSLDSLGKETAGHLIEKVRAINNRIVGLRAEGQGVVIRNNQVIKTGGFGLPTEAIGIAAAGPGSSVLGNSVVDNVGTSTTRADIGVHVEGDNCVVEGNRVSNSIPSNLVSVGIAVHATSSGTTIVNNRIAKMAIGIDAAKASNGYGHNTVGGAKIPFQGGADLGGNVSF